MIYRHIEEKVQSTCIFDSSLIMSAAKPGRKKDNLGISDWQIPHCFCIANTILDPLWIFFHSFLGWSFIIQSAPHEHFCFQRAFKLPNPWLPPFRFSLESGEAKLLISSFCHLGYKFHERHVPKPTHFSVCESDMGQSVCYDVPVPILGPLRWDFKFSASQPPLLSQTGGNWVSNLV